MAGRKKQSLLNGALVLVVATAFVEIVGVLYKIPLTELIGTMGRGYTGTAFNIYIPVYNIAMAGLPVAISKLVAQSVAAQSNNDALTHNEYTAPWIFLNFGAVRARTLPRKCMYGPKLPGFL